MKRFVQGFVCFVGMALFAGSLSAKTCDLVITGNDQMQFDKKELNVAADCTEVKLTLKHVGKLAKAAMGHNWILSTKADMNAVVAAGVTAGAEKDYTPQGDKRVLASTKMVGGGETSIATFKTAVLKKGEVYSFFCSFPGHFALMNGTLTFGKAAAVN